MERERYLNVTMIAALVGCTVFWAAIVHLAMGWL